MVERHLAEPRRCAVQPVQPSLHKMSIMCHRVRVMGQSTFRLNLTVTTPYNADFDGDEMNLHVPQTPEARVEALHIMGAAADREPAVEPPVMQVMDSLLGACCRAAAAPCWASSRPRGSCTPSGAAHRPGLPRPAVVWPQERWTGKQLLSTCCRRCSCAAGAASPAGPRSRTPAAREDTLVVIRRGHLLSGVKDKGVLGSSSGVVHVCQNSFGPETTRASPRQRAAWCSQRLHAVEVGFSTGLCKTPWPSRARQGPHCGGTIRGRRDPQQQPTEIGGFTRHPGTPPAPPPAPWSSTDLPSSNRLRRCRHGGRPQGQPHRTPASVAMACVGQQNVDGKRMPPCAMDSSTMPHFACQETSLLTRLRARLLRGRAQPRTSSSSTPWAAARG